MTKLAIVLAVAGAAASQQPPSDLGHLRQIIPGHYVYTLNNNTVLFVPRDRIVYMSEVFFNEEFPNMAGGYGVSWVKVLDAVRALDADIFIPGHGPIPDDPTQTRAALDRARQILVDARDAVQGEIAQGATEDQAVAAITLDQYSKLFAFGNQREVVLRRIYKELKGTLQ